MVPGAGDDSKFVKEIIEPVLGSTSHEQAANLRRLHLENYMLTAADLKRHTESSESDLPRKMPPTEVAERMALLQKKLTPLIIKEQLEPSHQVVNWDAQTVGVACELGGAMSFSAPKTLLNLLFRELRFSTVRQVLEAQVTIMIFRCGVIGAIASAPGLCSLIKLSRLNCRLLNPILTSQSLCPGMSEETASRSRRLCAILGFLVSHKPKAIVRQVAKRRTSKSGGS